MMKKAVDVLRKGGTILYPSDTIWGLGCDARNEAACQQLLQIKNRPKEKSFIILVDGWPMLERYVPQFNEVCYDLADLSEKPLTIIYPCASGLAPTVLASDGSVGVRITKDPLCLALIRGMNGPLVSTSANVSSERSPTNYTDIDPSIKSGVDYIILQRTNETMSISSQIIKIGLNGEVQLIRK